MGLPASLSAFAYSAPSPADTNVQEFRLSGQWVKPAGANIVYVECLGAGGGGGGGNGFSAGGTATNGSAGGGGAGYSARMFRASELPSTVQVTIGAGGAGGAGAGTSSGAGTNGSAGGNSLFGQFLTGFGGGGGQADSTTTSSSNGGKGGGQFSAGTSTVAGEPSVALSSGHFGGYTVNTASYPSGSVWGGGSGDGGNSLLGGAGGGLSGPRNGGAAIADGGGAPGIKGNPPVYTYLGACTFGANGINGINSGGYAGQPTTYDGAFYSNVVQYGSFYYASIYSGTAITSARAPVRANFPNAILRSSTGTGSWSIQNTNVRIFHIFIGVGGEFVGIGSNTAIASTSLFTNNFNYYTSTDGLTWTLKSSLSAAGSFPAIPAVVNGYYVIQTTANSTSYLYSSDLITWTSGTFASAVTGYVQGATNNNCQLICFCNGEYIAQTNNSQNVQYATDIAGPWTNRSTGLASGTPGPLTTNGSSRIVGQFSNASPYLYYSNNNGASWTLCSGTVTGASTTQYAVLTFVNSNYISAFQSNLWYSSDGITWATATDGQTNFYMSAYWDGTRYLVAARGTGSAATTNVAIYATALNGTWTASTFSSTTGAGGNGGKGDVGCGGGAGAIGATGGRGGDGGPGVVRITSW